MKTVGIKRMKTVVIRTLARVSGRSWKDVRLMLEYGWSTELLAAASGVTGGYVRRLLRDGELRGVLVSRDWLVSKSDGDEWLRARGIVVRDG